MEAKDRLSALRGQMRERNIDIYLVPTADFHESEYVGDYFKAREYLTGFTGSAGTAVVTRTEAGLWTDGRYYLQAERELSGSGFRLYRSGEEGVPKPEEFVKEHLPAGGVLGFDGRVVNSALAAKYAEAVGEKNGRLEASEDLVGRIWENRPPLPAEPVWILEERYSGESARSKIARVRAEMEKEGADAHLLSSLCDIAWLLNLRGGDIRHVPVFLSYLLLTKEDCALYVQGEACGGRVWAYLEDIPVRIRLYGDIYGDLAALRPRSRVWIDESVVNYRLRSSLPESAEIFSRENPTEQMRAVKNETEIRNTREAHIRDGAAVTKFMYWLKTRVGKEEITECSAGAYLDSLRARQEDFLDLSFDNICAYGANAAMMHYAAKEEDCARLRPEGFFLVDSGGHYLGGSTDITRTIVLGPLSDAQKRHFTAVCRGCLNLANAKFLKGCRGTNLDILCREPLWKLGTDYRCGTGHGVGHILNVHEGPNGFRWRIVPERKDDGILLPGMITTDEPGVYLDGEYGIRTENELLCIEAEKNEYGQFLKFEPLTWAPIDLDGILPEEMTETERGYLNAYHRAVYEKISPYLEPEEREWLAVYTREI